MTDHSYVCAFRGRRDSYQVPLALAEAGWLDAFITDAYSLPWLRALSAKLPQQLREKIAFRHEPGIPNARVRCLWGTTLHEHLRHRLGCAPMVTYNKLDARFSEAAAARAARTRADLFLYSPYAWEAFTARYPHTPRKVLFQYHPHPEMESRIMMEDKQSHPGIGESFSGTDGISLPEALTRRERDAWRHADLIFCASSFTRRSLVEAGCDESRCRIVPYGIELPEVTQGYPGGGAFHAVMVGSGGQRKGLHHLLLAWRRAALPANSRLTLVCRVLDRGIRQLVAETPRVELRTGVSAAELNRLYATSTLFVMPSLVEGFGQVYLEALAQGCPVLGTPNTCLPDIGTEADGVFITPTGDVEVLTARLEFLAVRLMGDTRLRVRARDCAARFTWAAFRKGIQAALAA